MLQKVFLRTDLISIYISELVSEHLQVATPPKMCAHVQSLTSLGADVNRASIVLRALRHHVIVMLDGTVMTTNWQHRLVRTTHENSDTSCAISTASR